MCVFIKLVFFYLSLLWVNYIIFLFWVFLFFFLLKPNNILVIILYSELIWIIIYTYISIISINNDDIAISTAFFLLALAGLEFSTGFLIIILFKNFKKSLLVNNFDFFFFKKNYTI